MEGAKPKRSVEDVWRELNAPRPVVRSAAASGMATFGIPGVTTHTRILPRHPPTGSAAAPGAQQGGDAGSNAVPTTTAPPSEPPSAPSCSPEQAGVSGAELQSYLAGMQRTINCLTDPDRSTRRSAIDAISAKLLRGDAASPAAAPQMLQAALCGQLLQPLLAMLGDPVERCRAGALQLLLEASARVPQLEPLLPPLLGALGARVGQLPPLEPAEELRLQAAALVGRAVERASPSALAAQSGELCGLLAAGLADPYHEIKKSSAAALAVLAGRVEPAVLESHAERLVQVLTAGLSHPHSRVRLSLLSALDALLSVGAVPQQLVQGAVAPGVRPLAADRASAVREAFFAAAARWMGAGGGGGEAAGARAQLHAPLLLPLLLLGVSDESGSVAELALAQVEAVGDAWQFGRGSGDAAAAGAGAAAPMESGEEAVAAPMQVDGCGSLSLRGDGVEQAADTGGEAAVQQAAVAAAALPPPYRGLPGAGARAMGAALLPELLPPMLRDLR
ncbi:hypothetical protein MNEG_14215, partial [Monoraphidium neglectum]